MFSNIIASPKFLFCFTCTLSLLCNMALAQDEAWELEAKRLGPPAAASDQLRNSIANSPQPNVSASSQAPQTEEQWRAIIGMRANAAPKLEDLEQQFNVSIETDTVEDVQIFIVTPDELDSSKAGQIFLHLHGGAYVFNGGTAAVTEAIQVAVATGIHAISVDYRMPPDHPFPTAVDDAVAVYNQILERHDAKQVAIGGTSAGGGLALAAIHKMKELGLDLPGAAYLGTPWADLTDTSDSLHTNQGIDRVLVNYYGLLKSAAELYAGDYELTHPLISPLYGDFSDFPPTVLITGTRDMLLSDTARVHRKLRDQGIAAELHVFEGLSHAGYLFEFGSPEFHSTFSEINAFFETHLR